MTPWQAPLAAGIYWALQNLPGPRLASGGHPPQLNHTYFRACLNQTGSKYRYDLVEARWERHDRLTVLGQQSRRQDKLTVLGPGGKIGLQCWAWRRAPSWAPVAGRGVRPRETGPSPSFGISKSRDGWVSTGLKIYPLHLGLGFKTGLTDDTHHVKRVSKLVLHNSCLDLRPV